MNNESIIIARRIAREMAKIATAGVGEQALQYFMGLGVALGIIWEVSTGKPPGAANRMKPQEILEWAKNLPVKSSRIVIPN